MDSVSWNDDDVAENESVLVRALRAEDLERVVKVDAQIMGRARRPYYEAKFKTALEEGKLQTSLVAEVDGIVVGYLLAKVYYGEFGQTEPTAVFDTIGVDPKVRGQHVGQALLRQLVMNLRALRVERLDTQVEWDSFKLLSFLAAQGFKPAPRIPLTLSL